MPCNMNIDGRKIKFVNNVVYQRQFELIVGAVVH